MSCLDSSPIGNNRTVVTDTTVVIDTTDKPDTLGNGPFISSISPNSGFTNSIVKIRGSQFDPNCNSNKIVIVLNTLPGVTNIIFGQLVDLKCFDGGMYAGFHEMDTFGLSHLRISREGYHGSTYNGFRVLETPWYAKWERVNVLDQPYTFYPVQSFAAERGIWVISTGQARIAYSYDNGTTWKDAVISSNRNGRINKIRSTTTETSNTYRFHGVTDSGTILESSTGTHWTEVYASTTEPLPIFEDIVYRDSLFVAVGYVPQQGAIVAISEDGQSWKEYPISPLAQDEVPRCVGWSGQRFVTAGDNAVVLESPDGIDWNLRYRDGTNSRRINDLMWANDQFYLGGTRLNDSSEVAELMYLSDAGSITFEQGEFSAAMELNSVANSSGVVAFGGKLKGAFSSGPAIVVLEGVSIYVIKPGFGREIIDIASTPVGFMAIDLDGNIWQCRR